MSDILVIGGGAAGMMAALFAARAGADVLLLEHNEKLGKKIYITGKGRCNLTNLCDRDEFLSQVPRNPRFLFSALDFFGPRHMMALLEGAGCPVTEQRGHRVFPASEKASDVTKALSSLLRQAGVTIRLRTEVQSLAIEGGALTGVQLADSSVIPARAVILATGGCSYPSTGSTGDGFRIAREAGHSVIPPLPSLSGLETAEEWPSRLQGLSLRNVTLTLSQGKKILYRELGELLFTHFGLSGPLILEASCHLPEDAGGLRLSLDLKPGLTAEQLDARLRREFTAAGKKQLRNLLPVLLPLRLAECFPALCGFPEGLTCNQVTGPQRAELIARLKDLPLTIRSRRPLEEAIITRGGVSVKEIQPGTMESRKLSGLFLAGEVIDVDAHTGGFNLQIAWSTGALAGQSAAEKLKGND